MAGFLYFIPDLHGVPTLAAIPAECNLQHLEGSSLQSREVVSGPGGRNGLIVTVVTQQRYEGVTVGYKPDEQEWTEVKAKCDDGEKTTHWIGVTKSSPPTPEDLARSAQIPGWKLQLGEHEWTIPCAHLPITTLPMVFSMTASGPTKSIEGRYEDLCKEMGEVYNAIYAKGDDEILTYERGYYLACKLLAVNYMLGPWEAGVLKMLTSKNLVEIVFAGLGRQLLAAEVEAKKIGRAHV